MSHTINGYISVTAWFANPKIPMTVTHPISNQNKHWACTICRSIFRSIDSYQLQCTCPKSFSIHPFFVPLSRYGGGTPYPVIMALTQTTANKAEVRTPTRPDYRKVDSVVLVTANYATVTKFIGRVILMKWFLFTRLKPKTKEELCCPKILNLETSNLINI